MLVIKRQDHGSSYHRPSETATPCFIQASNRAIALTQQDHFFLYCWSWSLTRRPTQQRYVGSTEFCSTYAPFSPLALAMVTLAAFAASLAAASLLVIGRSSLRRAAFPVRPRR